MPAYNFQRQFVPNVVAGLAYGVYANMSWPEGLATLIRRFSVSPDIPRKRQTIRLCRKRPTKAGETLYLYTGMRTEQCVKLGEEVCKTVKYFRLYQDVAGWLHYECGQDRFLLTHKFAQAEGFKSTVAMEKWFKKTHGLPFTGELIIW